MPFCFAGLAPRPGADPDAHRNRPHVRHALGDDADAVRQRRDFDIARGGQWERHCWGNLLKRHCSSCTTPSGLRAPNAKLGIDAATPCRHGTCRHPAALGPGSARRTAPQQIYDAVYQPVSRNSVADHDTSPSTRELPGSRVTPWACPRSHAATIPPTAPAATCCGSTTDRTVETVLMPEGERDTHLHFEPGRLPGGLQVLPDGAAGPGAQPDRRRDRRPGAAGGRENGLRRESRPPQHRDDGPGRAAAEPAERAQGHAPSDWIPKASAFRRAASRCRPPASFPRSRNWAASRCARSWRSR